MSLKYKIIPFIIITNILFIIGIYLFSQFVISEKVSEIEKDQLVNLSERSQLILYKQVSTLSATSYDYAVWDDTYNFVNQTNQDYISNNYESDSFQYTNIDLIIILDKNKNVLYDHISEKITQSDINYVLNDIKNINISDPLDGFYLMQDDRSFMIALQPITNSTNTQPSNGTLIMATYISEEIQEEINELIGRKMIWIGNYQKPTQEILETDETLSIFKTIPTINNKLITTSIDIPRSIRLSIFETRNIIVSGIVLIGILITAIALFILQQVSLKPLKMLLEEVTNINSLGKDAPQIHIPSDDEYGKLAIGINRMLVKLKKNHDQIVNIQSQLAEKNAIEQKKDEFFSIASHELRTPLTAIRGNIEFMQQKYSYLMEENPKLRDTLEDILSATKRLVSLVNQFLLTSKIDLNNISPKLESIDIRVIVDSVIKSLDPLIQTKEIKIQVNCETEDPKAKVDSNFAIQIFTNIISNSIKFSNTKGSITCKISDQNNQISIDISDNGRGIPAIEQIELFQRFKQGFTNLLARDVTQGSGLGLYISKKLAQSCNGDVELIKSEEGVGSVFRITFPKLT
jgi:signal transduction histidine kinase